LLTALPKFPQAIIDIAIEFATTVSTSSEFSLGGDPRTFCIQCPQETHNEIAAQLPIFPDAIHRFRFTKGSSNPHYDSRRQVALQIPVQIDFATSRCFYADPKFLDQLSVIESPEKTGDDGVVRKTQQWKYQEEYFNHFDYSVPFIMDTKYPHGGFVRSNLDTILVSVSYYDLSYDQVLPAYSQFS